MRFGYSNLIFACFVENYCRIDIMEGVSSTSGETTPEATLNYFKCTFNSSRSGLAVNRVLLALGKLYCHASYKNISFWYTAWKLKCFYGFQLPLAISKVFVPLKKDVNCRKFPPGKIVFSLKKNEIIIQCMSQPEQFSIQILHIQKNSFGNFLCAEEQLFEIVS